jgi:hypothetical protein
MPIVLIILKGTNSHSYTRLIQHLNSLGENWSPSPNVWLLKSSLNPSTILNRVRISLSSGDDVLIMEITNRYATTLPEGEKAWLYANLRS